MIRYKYKRLGESSWHYLQMTVETHGGIIEEYGTLRKYLNTMIHEKLEIERSEIPNFLISGGQTK